MWSSKDDQWRFKLCKLTKELNLERLKRPCPVYLMRFFFFSFKNKKPKYLGHDFQWAIFESSPFCAKKEIIAPTIIQRNTVFTNLVPRAFPLKKGWGFSRPTHLREKPWGRGWVFTIPFLWKMIYKPRRVLWACGAGLSETLANYRPHLSHFWANVIFAIPT